MLNRRTLLGSGLAATTLGVLPGCATSQPSRPFKIFDCHGHFYTDDWHTYPFDAHTARYGPERMVAKAMDNPMTPEAVFAFWDAAGIERGLGVQYSSTYFTDNSYLLHIAAEHPDRITPIVILDALDPETPATLERMARENGAAGNRFIGAQQNGEFPYLSDAALPVWEKANEMGLTVTLLPLGGDPAATMQRVAELADRYPNLSVVLDHIGLPVYARSPSTFGYTEAHLRLAEHPNIYYKHSTFLMEMLVAAEAPLDEFMEYSVETFGADHMVWGSDIGNSEVDDLEYVQLALDSAAGLPLSQQQAIFYDTAANLFVPGGHSA